MKVFVTGGTGATGGHAIPALLAAGHAVTALARSPEKAAELSEQGAEPVRVSIFDRPALAEAMAGHAAVVNLASAIPPMSRFMRRGAWRDNDGIRTDGSAAVVTAAIDAGVGRVDRSTSLTRSLRVSNARFRSVTGWAPRYPSAREGWMATAAALT
jgi:nucleoside-diphosphate-sugar epimerase